MSPIGLQLLFNRLDERGRVSIMTTKLKGWFLVVAICFASQARAGNESLDVAMVKTGAPTTLDATFCSNDTETALHHDDGGVLNYNKICVILHETPGYSISSIFSMNVTWRNHYVVFDRLTLDLFYSGSPSTALYSVRLQGGKTPCPPTPFNYRTQGNESLTPSGPPILLNTGSNAVLHIDWHTPDNSLC